MSSNGQTPWWEVFYDDTYADWFLSDEAGAGTAAARYLVEVLGLTPGYRVLDQCCGVGRVSLPLARLGMRVLGVEQSAGYVARARHRSASEDLACEFHVGDARGFEPEVLCDAGFSWATSFGHFSDHRDNIALLIRARASLRSGGRFALEYYGLPGLLRVLQPRWSQQRSVNGGILEVTRDSEVDFQRGLLLQRWQVTLPDGDTWRGEGTTRMYMPHELVACLQEAGFVDVALVPGMDGAAFGFEADRCVVVGTAP